MGRIAGYGFSFGDGVSGAGGAGFVVPDSATLPFANLAARNAWAAANLAGLIESQTVVSVTGSPTNTWFLWRGASNPSSHDPANWIDATPLVRGAMGVDGVMGIDGPAGLIQALTEGDRVTIDSTDPARPIITPTLQSELFSELSDGALPRWIDANNRVEDSGFTINSVSGALETDSDIITSGRVQAGVSTFSLGLSHDITSAAENVSFTNTATDTVLHPTWQTAGIDGNWNSVQRTPVGSFIDNEVFQGVSTEQITNPNFLFTSLSVNHRLYDITVIPVNTVSNVRVVIQLNNGTEFVDYWRSMAVDIVGGAVQNFVLRPFIDLMASTQYRFRTISDEDVILLGDTSGVPRILLSYWQWEDLPLAPLRSVISNVLGLSDTPAAFGTAGQLLSINTAVDALEFVDPTVGPAGPAGDMGAQGNMGNPGNEGAQGEMGNEGAQGDIGQTGQTGTQGIAGEQGPAGMDGQDGMDGAASFIALSDTPGTITANQFVRGNTGGTALEFVDAPTVGGSDTFTGLTDTPASLTADNFIRVNSAGDALEFTTTGVTGPTGPAGPMGDDGAQGETGTAGAMGDTGTTGETGQQGDMGLQGDTGNDGTPGAATFTALTDTPASFTANQFVRANTAGTALEFVDSPGSADLGNFRFDNTVEIRGDITITAANSATYNLKIWLFTAGSHTVNISAGTTLSFFGVYVRRVEDSGTIQPTSGNDVRVNSVTTPIVFTGRQSATFFSITANRFTEIFNNFRPEDFLDLSDTPAAFGTAGQLSAVNSTADALEFIDAPTAGMSGLTVQEDGTQEGDDITTVNFTTNLNLSVSGAVATVSAGAIAAADTRWDPQPLPATTLPNNNRRFYVYRGVGNVSVAMPSSPETTLFNGWHVFVANDSLTATLTITGNFRDSITSISLLAQQGCEIVYYSGATTATQYYAEGPARETITIEQFPPFRSVLAQNVTYTEPSTGLTWRSSTGGINLSNRPAILDLRGMFAQVAGHTTTFIFDLPSLPNADLPVGMGFAVGNIGGAQIQIRTRSNDRITGLGISYDFARPLILPVSSSVTLVVQTADLWNITQVVGAIGGGF